MGDFSSVSWPEDRNFLLRNNTCPFSVCTSYERGLLLWLIIKPDWCGSFLCSSCILTLSPIINGFKVCAPLSYWLFSFFCLVLSVSRYLSVFSSSTLGEGSKWCLNKSFVGVTPLLSIGVFRYNNKANCISLLSWIVLRKICLTVCMYLSANPFDWWCFGVTFTCWKFYCWENLVNSRLVNCVPASEYSNFGTPNLAKIRLSAFIVVVVVKSVKFSISTYLLYESTNKYFLECKKKYLLLLFPRILLATLFQPWVLWD